MLLKARDDLGLDLARSVFIGDKDSDMAAGLAAGVGHLIKLVPACDLRLRGRRRDAVDSLQAAAACCAPMPRRGAVSPRG